MSLLVLTDAAIYAGYADLTGNHNKVDVGAEAEEKDSTSFASGGWKEVLGGIKSWMVQSDGGWESDTGLLDPSWWADLGESMALTVCPDNGASAGDVAYFGEPVRSSYAPATGGVGEVAAWSGKSSGKGPLISGQVAKAKTAVASTGQGSALNLGAVGAAQRLWVAAHVFSVSGTTPTLDLVVQTDDNAGFTSATDQITLDQITTAGAVVQSTAIGAITDTYQRVTWTVGGTTPSFLLFVAIGIGD